MKRQFFSLMVAACAALFSFSCLTGCGGGGASDDADGYLTLDGFSKHGKGIRLESTACIVKILPHATDSEKDTDNTGNTRSMWCYLKNGSDVPIGKALVTYTITAYASSGSINDTSGAIPLYGTMTISMNDLESTRKADILAGFGLNTSENVDGALISALVLNLTFKGNGGGEVHYSVLGTTGAWLDTDEDKSVNVWGDFSVIKGS